MPTPNSWLSHSSVRDDAYLNRLREDKILARDQELVDAGYTPDDLESDGPDARRPREDATLCDYCSEPVTDGDRPIFCTAIDEWVCSMYCHKQRHH